jgi:signal transduction histidine kinase
MYGGARRVWHRGALNRAGQRDRLRRLDMARVIGGVAMRRRTPHKRWLSRRDRWILTIAGPMIVAVFASFWAESVREAFRRDSLVRVTSDAEMAVDNAVGGAATARDASYSFIEPDTSTWAAQLTVAVAAVTRASNEVRKALSGRPVAMAWLDTLTRSATATLAACNTAVTLRRSGASTVAWDDAEMRADGELMQTRVAAASLKNLFSPVFHTRLLASQRQQRLVNASVLLGTLIAVTFGMIAHMRFLRELDAHVSAQAILAKQRDLLRKHAAALDALRESAESARRSAEDANQSKLASLRTLSHELRTPLNAIIGYTDLLAAGVRGALTPVQTTDIERIHRAATHLLSLINDMFRFASNEASEIEVSSAPMLVGEVIVAASGMVEPHALSKQVSLESLPGDGVLAARADRDKVLQILLNLLTNAVKFTPSGGRIVIASRANDAVDIDVRDNGRGIDPDQLEHIFEPFVQVGRTLDSEHKGVGLGLAISRQLARAMGGDVVARSTPGEGSVFTLVLPREYPTSAESATLWAAPDAHPTSAR